MLHVTCDMWHVTRARDTWHVTCLRGWTFSQNFSSLARTVCDLWYYEDLEEKDDWLDQWINEKIYDKAVCRMAQATPGLLKTFAMSKIFPLFETVVKFAFFFTTPQSLVFQTLLLSLHLTSLWGCVQFTLVKELFSQLAIYK